MFFFQLFPPIRLSHHPYDYHLDMLFWGFHLEPCHYTGISVPYSDSGPEYKCSIQIGFVVFEWRQFTPLIPKHLWWQLRRLHLQRHLLDMFRECTIIKIISHMFFCYWHACERLLRFSEVRYVVWVSFDMF